jgi:hypothetical protein
MWKQGESQPDLGERGKGSDALLIIFGLDKSWRPFCFFLTEEGMLFKK